MFLKYQFFKKLITCTGTEIEGRVDVVDVAKMFVFIVKAWYFLQTSELLSKRGFQEVSSGVLSVTKQDNVIQIFLPPLEWRSYEHF